MTFAGSDQGERKGTHVRTLVCPRERELTDRDSTLASECESKIVREALWERDYVGERQSMGLASTGCVLYFEKSHFGPWVSLSLF